MTARRFKEIAAFAYLAPLYLVVFPGGFLTKIPIIGWPLYAAYAMAALFPAMALCVLIGFALAPILFLMALYDLVMPGR